MPDLDAKIRARLIELEWDSFPKDAALRAVLDAHPEGKVRRAPYMDEVSICETCSVGGGLFAYPCTTVARIADALGVAR